MRDERGAAGNRPCFSCLWCCGLLVFIPLYETIVLFFIIGMRHGNVNRKNSVLLCAPNGGRNTLNFILDRRRTCRRRMEAVYVSRWGVMRGRGCEARGPAERSEERECGDLHKQRHRDGMQPPKNGTQRDNAGNSPRSNSRSIQPTILSRVLSMCLHSSATAFSLSRDKAAFMMLWCSCTL
jgi:hypothetical protein